ncbi:MAG: fumarylacetoacetate hydrolase [Comamonadaceae bacterium]|nr:MAG: fumarylacetoacetate hydrolase [Comamonadaceae bacterium]
MKLKHTLAAVALGTLAVHAAQAACLSDAQVGELFTAMTSKVPAANWPDSMSEADATCTRAKLNRLQAARQGPVIGYKAGLTNPAVQKRFNYDKPVWGVLYQGMVLDTGAVVDAAFGARPLFEADLLVRVKSDAINRAKTPADVLAAVDQIIPFIELPDLVVQEPSKLNGPGVAAINVGARFGVKGLPILVPQTEFAQAFLLDAMRDMTVRLNDGKDGAEIARGKGSDILGHPLNAVVWLADALGREGLAMRPGLTVIATYDGLPGAQPVVVSFK